MIQDKTWRGRRLTVVLLLALDANGSEREHGEESEVPDDELKPERVVDLRSCRELVHEAEDAVHERDSERLPLVVDERHDWRAHDRRPHRESAVENYLFIVKVVENKYDRWGLMTVSSQMFILFFSKEGWTVNTTVLNPIETTNKNQKHHINTYSMHFQTSAHIPYQTSPQRHEPPWSVTDEPDEPPNEPTSETPRRQDEPFAKS